MLDSLKDVFGTVSEHFDKEFIEKVYSYLEKHNPDLFSQIKKLKAKLKTKLNHPLNKDNVDDFLKEDKEWRELVYKGVKQFTDQVRSSS